MDALAFELPEPSASEYDRWFTLGSWETEEASASALDERIERTGMFRIHREVWGSLIQPRAGQTVGRMRIDRILMPTPELVGLGWRHGAVGVEVKRSGMNIGPPLAQAMDYLRGSWLLSGGTLVQVSGVFLWPMHSQGGPLSSVMAHNRIGSAGYTRTMSLHFAYGEEVVFSDGSYSGFQVRRRSVAGTKVGSR